jgi:hypothetical protein
MSAKRRSCRRRALPASLLGGLLLVALDAPVLLLISVVLPAPTRRTSFMEWLTKPARQAPIWSTTALFGGVTCSLLHVSSLAAAMGVYWSVALAAQTVMLPWYLAARHLERAPQEPS